MKKVFKAISAITAVIAFVYVVSAFTKQPEQPEARIARWFVYDLESQEEEDIEQQANYSPYSSNPADVPDCASGDKLCAIYAEDDNGQPNIDPTLLSSIMTALDNPETHSEPNVRLRD